VANAPKVYDFPMAKVEDQLVSYLKTRRGESTIADMIAGTGLPKYQVEQAAKVTLDEYAGRLKVTESGELLYYFPSGMQSTVRGLGPSLRKFGKAFARGAARVLSFLFKVWIVAMLVGYFVAFVALVLLAVLASFAASAASRGERGGGRERGGGGFGSMYLVIRLLDLILRMWFWTTLLKDPKRKKEGRAFYKSVFGFVFGEGDPNTGWEEAERKHIISYIRSREGVITLEELMALTGRESEEANALMNRILLEYEGEPEVTDNGTVVYVFPELLRTSPPEHTAIGKVPLQNPSSKQLVPFAANKGRTNGWILFFNAANLAFGSYFTVLALTQGAAGLGRNGSMLYAFTGSLLARAGISPVPFMEIVLGFVPIVFSVLFFIVPFLRKILLDRRNAGIRLETLRRRIFARVLSSPARVDASDIAPAGSGLDPRDLTAATSTILERLAASLKAEPIVQEKEGSFAYRFTELERQLADLEEYRAKIDLARYRLGKTVFDSGK